MLDKLQLIGFQAHESSELKFSKGVNIITGTSNSGKTSIVRALNWLVNNKPGGDGFIKDDKEGSDVILSFYRQGNELMVHRYRNRKTTNVYSYEVDSQVDDFTAFGSSVPEEIKNVLNLSDINLQQQLSPYFLVLDSPGQIALYIRKTARLDEIDKAVSFLASKIRDNGGQLKDLNFKVKNIENKLDLLSIVDLNRLEKLIKDVKETEKEKDHVFEQRSGLNQIVSQLDQLNFNMICFPDNIEEEVRVLGDRFTEFADLGLKCNSLKKTISQLEELKDQEINLPKDVENKFSIIEKLIVKYNNSEGAFIQLIYIIERLEEYEKVLDKSKEVLQQAEEKKINLLSQLKECPSCGTVLSESAKEILIENY